MPVSLPMINLKRERLYRRHEIAKEKILALILSGDLVPGDRLLPERELAKELSVSRPAVRQALFSLESMGLVRITPRGTYVTLTDIGESLPPIVATMVRQRHALMEFIEFRKILEIGAVRLAALRARPEDVSRIDRYIREMESNVKDKRDPFEPDLQFHIALTRASHNLFLNEMMTLMANVAKSDAYAPIRNAVYAPPGELEAWVARSWAILEAIRAGDPELAAREMTDYLNRVEGIVKDYFEGRALEENTSL